MALLFTPHPHCKLDIGQVLDLLELRPLISGHVMVSASPAIGGRGGRNSQRQQRGGQRTYARVLLDARRMQARVSAVSRTRQVNSVDIGNGGRGDDAKGRRSSLIARAPLHASGVPSDSCINGWRY